MALYPTRIDIAMAGGARSLQMSQLASLNCGSGRWQEQLETIDGWLADNVLGAYGIEFVLGSHLARYAHVPWTDDLDSAAELQALGLAIFHGLFGPVATEWDVAVDLDTYERAGLACALDRALPTALHALAAAHRLRLTGIRPHFMHVFNEHRHRIGANGLLLVLDSARCVIACIRDGDWRSIRAIELKDGVESGVGHAVARERLLQGMPEEFPVYLHAAGPVALDGSVLQGDPVILNSAPAVEAC